MSYDSVPPPPPAVGSAPGFSQGQRDRQNKSLVRIIIFAVLGVGLLIVLFIAAIVAVVFGALKSSEPYQHAVQAATSDPRVLAELGPPVKPGWMFSGSINTTGPSGSADLSISLEGSRRKGTLYVVAKESAGRWSYQTLELRAEGQPDLDLLQPPSSPPEAR